MDEPASPPEVRNDLGRKALIGALVGFVVVPIVGRLVKWGFDATSWNVLHQQSNLVFKVLGAVGFVYGVFAVWEWASARYRQRRAG